MLSHLVDLQLKLRRLGANARDELLNFRAAVGVENLGDGLVRGRIENVTSLHNCDVSKYRRSGVRRKSAKMFGNDFCDLMNFFQIFFVTFSITVVLLNEVPEGVENGQNALNKRCRTYLL